MLEIQVCLAILGVVLVCLAVWIGTISSRVERIENFITNETSDWSTMTLIQLFKDSHRQDDELSNHTKALEALFERTESLERNKTNSVKLS